MFRRWLIIELVCHVNSIHGFFMSGMWPVRIPYDMSRRPRQFRQRLHCEALEERCLLAFDAFPAPQAVEPMGSFLYRSAAAGEFELAGEVDLYTVDLQAGQSVSLAGESDATLRLSLYLTGPDEQLIVGDLADALGQGVFLQSPTINQTGTHTIVVGGVEAMGGAYSVQLVLNGVVEESAYGGAANDLRDAAQDLASAFTALGVGAAERAAVVGRWPSDAGSLVAAEGFESGSLDARWTTNSSTENGRIRISNEFGPRAGFLALFMDTDNPAAANLNEAVWTVDLPPENHIMLEFSHSSHEIVQPLPAEFTGSVAGDGVAISGDGTRWHTIFTPPSEDTTWRDYQVDLTAAAEANNIELGSGFQIKFQQYGDGMLPAVGSGFDQIAITREFAGYEDWYQFPLEDGQTTSLRLLAEPPERSSWICLMRPETTWLPEVLPTMPHRPSTTMWTARTTIGQTCISSAARMGRRLLIGHYARYRF